MYCKDYVVKELAACLPDLTEEQISEGIEIPKEKSMGDYAFPCFRLAKIMHKAPNLIAQEVVAQLQNSEVLEKAEAVGPYVNMFLDKAWRAQFVLGQVDAAEKEGRAYGSSSIGEGKTVVMDYSSINVAKPFHIGHLRTTVIGNSISRILKFLGYKTVSINHLGDWGTQFGKMVLAYRKWGNPDEVEAKGVRGLLELYVRFHEEAERNPELEEEARATFTSMEQGDEEALKLWKLFVNISLKEVDKVYAMLDVQFDSYLGESYYWNKTDELIQRLKEKQLLQESEGAQIVDLSEDNMPPCLILKKDGSTLYTTRDIAAALYRKATYDFDKCLYITGMEQSLHFAQWFKVVEKMGYPWSQDLVHIPYGLVSLEGGGKLATRSGNVIFLEDLLKEAVQKTKVIMQEKNPDLENMDEVAEQVGVGAVVFHDLFNNRIKDVTFSWDQVLNFDGETGPYVQYTFARASSILRKAAWEPAQQEEIDMSCLTDEYSQELLKLIESFPKRVAEACQKWEPYMVTRYTVAMATAFNKFYHENSILNAEEAVKKARLKLTYVVAQIIKQGLYLIGVKAPEKM
ncbi:MAG: arginine--tRNA ligase [Lachnospiraceae bacterium]|jgi:arginyl-tRNA synthetase|nr:arginine--tRNA ligase [Lachnospiraceae bacterium]